MTEGKQPKGNQREKPLYPTAAPACPAQTRSLSKDDGKEPGSLEPSAHELLANIQKEIKNLSYLKKKNPSREINIQLADIRSVRLWFAWGCFCFVSWSWR